MQNKHCHCGSEKSFIDCCQPIIEQQQLAQNAERLMRSRFSAFKVQDNQWLSLSWDTTSRPEKVEFDEQLKWIDLRIINSKIIDNTHSTVEFEARYIKSAKVNAIHENSRFIKRRDEWFYVDGDYLKATFKPYKVKRNDECLCGSQLKFKHCCAKD